MGTYTKQIIKDTTTEVIVKFVGIVDANGPTTDPVNTTIYMSTLVGALDNSGANLVSRTGNTALANGYITYIRDVDWSFAAVPANSNIQLVWRGSTSNSVAMNMCYGQGSFEFDTSAGKISSDAVGNASVNTGELFLQTSGVSSAAYTIFITLRKDPRTFDKGALVDKAYFQNP